MHFSEDDLKDALRRKDPGPGFTQRVMARIARQQEAEAPARRIRTGGLRWLWTLRSHPALAGAMAALVLAIACWFGYQQYLDVQAKRKAEERSAELARQQVVEALRITNTKLNHVFQRVNQPLVEEPKTRRQTL